MHSSAGYILVLVYPLLKSFVRGLEVTPNSNCSSLCIDKPYLDISDWASSETFTQDLICEDWQYAGANATSAGRKWKACIGCESSSNRFNETTHENDVFFFLCKAYTSDGPGAMSLISMIFASSQFEVHHSLVRLWLPRQPQHNSGVERLRRCLR